MLLSIQAMTKYKLILLIIFAIVLIWSAINPPAGQADWLLENSPLFVAVLALIIFAHYLKLSNLSYTLILIYLVFPLVASHYGVAGVPGGEIIGHLIGSTRNMYDRLTHFLFGFLGFYPVQEFMTSISEKRSGWDYYVPLETILAFSAVYEIFEWVAAISVNPILATSFLGSQGDIFDTQKDMGMAIIGALCAMVIIFLFKKYRKNTIPVSS